MEQTERLTCLDALQKKLYAYACAENSLYLDAVTVAPKNTAEGRGVALGILAGEHQKLMTDPETKRLLDELAAAARSMLSTSARWSCCAARAGNWLASRRTSIWPTPS